MPKETKLQKRWRHNEGGAFIEKFGDWALIKTSGMIAGLASGGNPNAIDFAEDFVAAGIPTRKKLKKLRKGQVIGSAPSFDNLK